MGIDLPFCLQDANDILEVVIKNEKLENPKVTFLEGSKVGEGYLGINKAVDICDGNKTLHLFIKAAPKHDKFRESFLIKEVYSNEFHFYTVILPIMEELFTKKTGKSLELTSKFYAGSLEEMKEMFVFENLTSKGFALNNEKYVFGKERALLVMKEYGKFHGTSFALKDQDAQTFNTIIKYIPNQLPLVCDNFQWNSIIASCCKVVEKYFQSAEDSVLLEKLTYISQNVRKLFSKVDQYNGDYCTILHGDSNYNNLMFRNQDSGIELRLLDFQGHKLSSPVLDLVYFFYCTALSKENLAELDLFLTTYYNSLSSTIKELGSDPEKLCPFSVIKEHWKQSCVFGVLMAMILLPSMVNEGDPFDIVEIVANPVIEMSGYTMNNEIEYAKRIKWLLQHFIDNNFI